MICWNLLWRTAGVQLTFCLLGIHIILLPSQNALGEASEYIRKCSSTVLSTGAFAFKRNSRTVLSGRYRAALSPKLRSTSWASIDCKIEWNWRHEVERREILSFIHSVSRIRSPSHPPRLRTVLCSFVKPLSDVRTERGMLISPLDLCKIANLFTHRLCNILA